MNDLANVVARAIEFEGEWPIIGGIQGTTLRISQLLEIGVKVRGMEIHTLQIRTYICFAFFVFPFSGLFIKSRRMRRTNMLADL